MKSKFIPLILIFIFLITFVIFFKGLKNSNIYIPNTKLKKEVPSFELKSFENNSIIISEKIFVDNKYYLMNISYENSIAAHKFQKSEVSGMGWWPLSTCLEKIRPYNLEKIQVIKNIDECLQKTRMFTMAKI